MKNPDRIKILVLDNSVAVTGGIKAILSTSKDLQSEFDFLFVLPTTSTCIGLVEAQGFRCLTLPFREIRKNWRSLLFYFPCLLMNAYRLARIIRKENIVIVHANDLYNLCGLVARLFARFKLFTHVRILSDGFPTWLYHTWVTFHQQGSHQIICVSNAAKRPFKEAHHVHVIPDRTPQHEKYPYHYPPHDGDNHPIRLLYLANYIPGKGHHFALEAFERAFARHAGLRLVFCGGDMGLDKNRAYRQWLAQKASHGRAKDAITFRTFVPDIEKEIKAVHMVLNFSEAESFSLTCQEALFYGTPLIATDCGGPRELFEHMHSGWLVPNRNVEAMTEAIIHLSSNASLRKAFSENGRRYVREKFSRNRTSGKLAHLYRSVASQEF